MTTFWVCLTAVGLVLLVAQLFVGAEDAGTPVAFGDHSSDVADGLQFATLRTFSAGALLGGIVGWGLTRAGVPTVLVVAGAAAAALVASAMVAVLMRQLLRLQRDNSIRPGDLERAVGVVYLEVPPAESGLGKVHLLVREQLIELDAVTAFEGLPVGTTITVIDASRADCVSVVALPSDKELLSE